MVLKEGQKNWLCRECNVFTDDPLEHSRETGHSKFSINIEL